MRGTRSKAVTTVGIILASLFCISAAMASALVVGDDFSDSDFTSNPVWTVLADDPAHPWSISNKQLLFPIGYSGVTPEIALDFAAIDGMKLMIELDFYMPYPPGDHQPMHFALVNTDTNTGHNLWCNPYTPYGGTTGFAWSNYDSGAAYVGAAGEHIIQGWQHFSMIYDPTAGTIQVMQDDTTVMSFNTSLTKINRLIIAQNKNVVPYRVDNVSISYAGSLVSVFSDDFTGGIDPEWTIESGTWALWNYTDAGANYPGDVLRATNSGDIHVDFPEYHYDGTSATNNPNGPEWEVTLWYSNGRSNGNNYSNVHVYMGNADEYNAMRLQWNDTGSAWSGHKFAFYRGTGTASPTFGTGGDPQWTWALNWSQATGDPDPGTFEAARKVTFSWEASQGTNGTLYMTHEKPFSNLVVNSGSWQIGSTEDPFDIFNRLTIRSNVSGGKAWLFDNVDVKVYSQPQTPAEPASLRTVALDDFEDGDYVQNVLWTPDAASNWSVVNYSGNNVLQSKAAASSTFTIAMNFPTYIWGGAYDNATNNPNGPEWRVSWRYSLGAGNGAENSTTRLKMGTAVNPDQYELWESDICAFGSSGHKFVWRRDGNYSTTWGPTSAEGGNDATGIHWYNMTLEWEASTDTLTATFTDPGTDPLVSYTHSWVGGGSFYEYDQLSWAVSTGGGAKSWLMDDLHLEIALPPLTDCQAIWQAGLGLDADLNQDCYVDLQDFAVLSENWMTDVNP